jgi:hypothetical protein
MTILAFRQSRPIQNLRTPLPQVQTFRNQTCTLPELGRFFVGGQPDALTIHTIGQVALLEIYLQLLAADTQAVLSGPTQSGPLERRVRRFWHDIKSPGPNLS